MGLCAKIRCPGEEDKGRLPRRRWLRAICRCRRHSYQEGPSQQRRKFFYNLPILPLDLPHAHTRHSTSQPLPRRTIHRPTSNGPPAAAPHFPKPRAMQSATSQKSLPPSASSRPLKPRRRSRQRACASARPASQPVTRPPVSYRSPTPSGRRLLRACRSSTLRYCASSASSWRTSSSRGEEERPLGASWEDRSGRLTRARHSGGYGVKFWGCV